MNDKIEEPELTLRPDSKGNFKVDMSIIHEIQTPMWQLGEIDRILLARIQFPEPQPVQCFHSIGTSTQDKCTTAHEFLIPRKYVNPSFTEAVVLELALQRFDYWYRKTHDTTKAHVSIRALAGYLDLAEKIAGIVMGVDTFHAFHMPKGCAAFEAHNEAVERGLLPLRLPSGKLLAFNRKPRNLPPPPLHIICRDCEKRAEPITGHKKQKEYLSRTIPPNCGNCGGMMIELETTSDLLITT